ncbi:MAG: DUF1622 domain-containing protein [Rhizobiaceae bacterium]
MEPFFKDLTFYLAYAIEAAAAVIIAVAAAKATVGSVLVLFRRHPVPPPANPAHAVNQEDIRLELGRWLALALEFELAADILRTAVAPTWNEIGQLAAIIVLRTALNFFLRKEIEKAGRPSLTRPP